MGLYSTINKSALTLEESAEIDRLLDESNVTDRFGHLIEFVTMVDETDNQLFNSLIECDFITATNEAVLTEEDNAEAESQSSEVKKTKIWDKIKMVLAKLKEMIIKAGQSLIAKIVDLVKADKKIYDTYKNVLTYKNTIGFSGLKDFAYPKDVTKNESIINSFYDTVKYLKTAISEKNDRTEIDNAYENFKKDIEGNTNLADDIGFNPKVANFKPNQQQIDASLNAVKDGKTIIAGVKKVIKDALDFIKTIEKEAQNFIKAKRDDKDALDLFKANKISTMISEYGKSISKNLSSYSRITVQQIAAHRKLVIICGRYAAKKAKGEDPNAAPLGLTGPTSESMNWILGEASDDFVFEHFAY